MQRLVLLGGGHAHVVVARAFGAAPPAATAITLISRNRYAAYSGMLPGLIAGHYAHADCHIDLASLCAEAGIAFVEAEATGLDLERRQVICATGAEYLFDLISIDTGSTSPEVPGAAEHAITVKPTERFLGAVTAMFGAPASPGTQPIAVIGGGAAGFEIVLALSYRMRQGAAANAWPALHLFTEDDDILYGFPTRVRTCARAILARCRIQVHTDARVVGVDRAGIALACGAHVAAEHVILATGARAAPMYAAAGLRTDQAGFIAVDAGLRSLSHPCVFACGDIASVLAHPRPKAGVFAVRQGPPLAGNLTRALTGEPPLAFLPQNRYLVMLSAGEKYAIATRNGWTVAGAWVWRWKDWIDRRFMARFRPQRRHAAGRSAST